MKVKALRGVCVGVGRHLPAGATADLDPALVRFLTAIQAVEEIKDEPKPAEKPKASTDDSKPVKPAKTAGKLKE